MRVLVCGGRDFADRDLFARSMYEHVDQRSKYYNEFDNYLPYDIEIINGGAKGADAMATDWAIVNWCDYKEYPADWKNHGKKAGCIRNQQMLDEGRPELVLAFPGGRGTADMIRRAKKAGIETIQCV